MKISLCKHSFPIQPPEGWFGAPGPCRGCGITWADSQAEIDRQEIRNRAGSARPGACGRCGQHRMLFAFAGDMQFWDAEPPTATLCTPCWSGAAQAQEAMVLADPFDDAFDQGTDDLLRRYLAGA